MEIRYCCPYWGQEGTRPRLFFARAIEQAFDGIEMNIPDDAAFLEEFHSALSNVRKVKNNFVFILQQVLEPARESVNAYIKRMEQRLDFLASLHPDFINSHTGKDFYSFDENCRIIEAAENLAARTGVTILHETHRGRFSFHAASLLPYLEKFPDLKLTADFSHWCTVSESMLDDQGAVLEKIIPHVQHIHARIGFEQAPQVNDPFAPEWREHVDVFITWWKQILLARQSAGSPRVTITPEAGPRPYMPVLPYSQKPVADAWQINVLMKDMLIRRFGNYETRKPA